ncbi:hypothetical protein [Paraburkholderia caffeinitolerans]|uniref:hypothetical protein n=1 Tax=Paraburkholderia caffeinitolerans TaxID=1723730 RepID=UPI001FE37635|nr:hypothetical protein [Paraburkholderia caffeinitolerans]
MHAGIARLKLPYEWREQRDVKLTMVDGRVIYENGKACLVEQAEIVNEAQRRCHEMAQRLSLVG